MQERCLCRGVPAEGEQERHDGAGEHLTDEAHGRFALELEKLLGALFPENSGNIG